MGDMVNRPRLAFKEPRRLEPGSRHHGLNFAFLWKKRADQSLILAEAPIPSQPQPGHSTRKETAMVAFFTIFGSASARVLDAVPRSRPLIKPPSITVALLTEALADGCAATRCHAANRLGELGSMA